MVCETAEPPRRSTTLRHLPQVQKARVRPSSSLRGQRRTPDAENENGEALLTRAPHPAAHQMTHADRGTVPATAG